MKDTLGFAPTMKCKTKLTPELRSLYHKHIVEKLQEEFPDHKIDIPFTAEMEKALHKEFILNDDSTVRKKVLESANYLVFAIKTRIQMRERLSKMSTNSLEASLQPRPETLGIDRKNELLYKEKSEPNFTNFHKYQLGFRTSK